jgi:amidase
MSSSDFTPAFATMSAAADAVRLKQISARELVDVILQRIDRHNPTLNAIVWQDRERAMARAKQVAALYERTLTSLSRAGAKMERG